jgi:selenocysteine lyase/cysteine desulfurase
MRRSDDPLHQSAIVVFSTGAESSDRALVEFLAERKIIVALRPLGIRVAPHLFNTHAHVEQFLSALRDFAKS